MWYFDDVIVQIASQEKERDIQTQFVVSDQRRITNINVGTDWKLRARYNSAFEGSDLWNLLREKSPGDPLSGLFI